MVKKPEPIAWRIGNWTIIKHSSSDYSVRAGFGNSPILYSTTDREDAFSFATANQRLEEAKQRIGVDKKV